MTQDVQTLFRHWLRMHYMVIRILVIVGLLFMMPDNALADQDGSSVSIGVEWAGQYSGTGAPYEGNLSTADDAVAGLYDIVSDPVTAWLWDFNYGDFSAWELDWKAAGRLGGSDSIYCDNVDLAAWCGHGYPENQFMFNNQMDDWYASIGDMDMGDRDCEWILAFTCEFLKNGMSTFGPAADGVHLICGYSTDMTVTANAGSRFAYWAKRPYGVRVAWYKYGYDTQNGANHNIARTFGAKNSVNDYLWGYGSVSADPPFYTNSPGSYTYWDTKLNWQ